MNSTLTLRRTQVVVLPPSCDPISTTTLYKDRGDANCIIDPMGIETHWENDSRAVREMAKQTKRSVARRVSGSRGVARINLGRRIRLLEGISVERAAGSPANPDGRPSRSLHHVHRTTRFTSTPDGPLHNLILCNPGTGDQVTERQIGLLNTNTTGIGGIPAQQELFTYDETGNWLKYEQQDDGAVAIDQTRTHNRSNQLVTLDGDGTAIAYDKNGNMLEVPTGGAALDAPPRRLVWDAWNRLKEVHFHEDNADRIIAEYQYDAQTRRIITLADEVTRHHYYNDQWRSVEERLDEDTTAERQHVWHPADRWELILRDRSTANDGNLNEKLYSLKDQLDPVAICDTTGSVVERYGYTAFGMVSISNASFIPQPSTSSYNWSFLFHGEFRDTATHWYNYGYRYYMPEFGRWPDRDPIRERGGINTYAFANNSAVGRYDQLWLRSRNFDSRDASGLAGARMAKEMTEAEAKKRLNALERERRGEKVKDRGMGAVEFCGRVCCTEDKFYYTGPVPGTPPEKLEHWSLGECDPDSAPACDGSDKQVAEFHSHPGDTPTSSPDRERCDKKCMPGYMCRGNVGQPPTVERCDPDPNYNPTNPWNDNPSDNVPDNGGRGPVTPL